ncbi:unnamed protein product [Mytilus edulis]|uniref:DUF6589 domain-containing protein n=1 Tax=Mytilus edulis TaxID=6550 RepID=A0A8S3SQJ0_MYTED|nr:unnamed protein product [Mytilus edulis]
MSNSNLLQDIFSCLYESYNIIYGINSLFTNNFIISVDGVVIPIQLSNGKRRSYVIKKAQKSQTPQEDKVKNYGHLCLELGLQFKAILDLCKLPDRERGLRLLKVCMIHFKANNNLSKYAYEILRLLVHQLCILSEQEAHEEFYGLFVNTKGKIDSHIPCDLQMEYIVKSVKRNIKHMFSNKTDKNITTRTSALPAIKDIAENFDKTSGVIIRCTCGRRATHLKSIIRRYKNEGNNVTTAAQIKQVSDIYKSLITETFSEFRNFFQRTEFPENLDNGTECPACFTTLPKIYSFNADFQLVRKASSGKKWEEPKHCYTFFLDQTLVDGFIDNYYEDRGKPDVEPDHERHHEFISSPTDVYERERRTVAFGADIYQIQVRSTEVIWFLSSPTCTKECKERYVEELSSSDEQSEGEDEYYNEPVQIIDNLSNEDNHFVTQVSQILQKRAISIKHLDVRHAEDKFLKNHRMKAKLMSLQG